MKITLIAAMAQDRIIGIDNGMPWHLPAEMAHFRRSTTGKTVLMGRKTFESFGGPLKNRRNVVLTRSAEYKPEGAETVHSVDEAIAALGGEDELMIIGGAEIYAQFLPLADKLLLTEVDAKVEGDAAFPMFDNEQWHVERREFHAKDEKNAYDFTILTYVRIKPQS
ncbi:type 3 dihydrofolate reductase [Paenibacillus sacheonensis]|uniref:Dihydrofolate reductase n=1 Tax=Paenibacillus sacheonensis TaxID=742054 RepID=A0A7X4YKL0_9BACL|nr:type 3 dihydrofolate reductase [Paenibacillus sacheonensis]MBM7563339.1 dihydrofolate reductase [Paenibacillus sacheonensis]NBC68105.1 type 3 dihydrofolate reductase [Paenibacillus sacheonensis]